MRSASSASTSGRLAAPAKSTAAGEEWVRSRPADPCDVCSARQAERRTRASAHGACDVCSAQRTERRTREPIPPRTPPYPAAVDGNYVVFARTGDAGAGGISAFVVDGKAPGLTAEPLRTMGETLLAHQGIQFKLAGMEADVAAARALTFQAATFVAEGDPRMTKLSAMAKLVASDTAMRVTTEAVQVLGGNGYIKEFPAERMMRDARVLQIYEARTRSSVSSSRARWPSS